MYGCMGLCGYNIAVLRTGKTERGADRTRRYALFVIPKIVSNGVFWAFQGHFW